MIGNYHFASDYGCPHPGMPLCRKRSRRNRDAPICWEIPSVVIPGTLLSYSFLRLWTMACHVAGGSHFQIGKVYGSKCEKADSLASLRPLFRFFEGLVRLPDRNLIATVSFWDLRACTRVSLTPPRSLLLQELSRFHPRIVRSPGRFCEFRCRNSRQRLVYSLPLEDLSSVDLNVISISKNSSGCYKFSDVEMAALFVDNEAASYCSGFACPSR